MFNTEDKIKVFISSACGNEDWKQKYNYIREALKVVIKGTGFAEPYVFESEGASTISAGSNYISALEESNLCIFIIDNKDEVPYGVLKEVEIAKKYNIKSLFYFCDEFSKEETPLQEELKGINNATSYVIHDFKSIISQVEKDLKKDLINVYKYYCNGRLNFEEEIIDGEELNSIVISESSYSNNIMKKDLLINLDGCISYFINLLSDENNVNIKTSGNLDELCVNFLRVLFESEDFSKKDQEALLEELKKHQSNELFEVTEKRYEAIRLYYEGNQKECIEKLEESLELAKKNSLPKWLIDDILIDLRNQDKTLDESRNIIFKNSAYQKEIINSKTSITYPLLDRLSNNFYENIISDFIKDKTKAPGTVTYGNNFNKHIKSLVNIYVISVYHGSLTHIEAIYKRLRYLCFYAVNTYSDWKLKLMLLKTNIINGNNKEKNEVYYLLGDILSDLNSDDAFEIYSFSKKSRVPYKRFNSELIAFSYVAYYLNDKDFSNIWKRLYAKICEWIDDEEQILALENTIFTTIKETHKRIKQDDLINIIIKVIKNKKVRFYDQVFKIILNCINLDFVSKENQEKLIESISELVLNLNDINNLIYLNQVLIKLRKKYRNLTENLDNIIKNKMPDFYKGVYLLETTVNENIDFPKFINMYVEEMIEINEKIGKNGMYFTKAISIPLTIKNILQKNLRVVDQDLLDLVFKTSIETILNEHQKIEMKIDSIELLIYLVKTNKYLKDNNQDLINDIKSNKNKILNAYMGVFDNQKPIIELSVLLLYASLGQDINMNLIEYMATIGDNVFYNRKASELFYKYIEIDNFYMEDKPLKQLYIINVMKWCNSSDINTRLNAVQILYLSLNHPENIEIICNKLIKLIDTDNIYIRKAILENISLIKDINIECYNYIIKKTSNDTNYVIRKAANNLIKNKNIN